MSFFDLVSMFARERWLESPLPRGDSPMSVLGQHGVIQAMTQGGAVDGPTASGYLYHSARMSRVIAGSKVCADFGCGTGAQLLQVAGINPTIQFIGVDWEQQFLDIGETAATALGIKNVEWVNDDITQPTKLANRQIDAVISTMTLHNLRGIGALSNCFQAMRELVGAAGAIYIEDFSRLKSPKSVDYLVSTNGLLPNDKHSELFRASICAAFTLEELRAANSADLKAELYSTFLVPLLVVIKTVDRDLNPQARRRLTMRLDDLSQDHRRLLGDLHKFMSLGGLRDDPFR